MIWAIYDGAVILILLVSVFIGFRRGVLRTILGLVCIVLSCIIAGAVSSYTVSNGIYEKFFRQTVYEHIDAAVQKAKEEAAASIEKRAEEAADRFIDENLGGSSEAKDFAYRLFDEGRAFIDGAAPEIYSFFDDHKETLLTNPQIYGKIEDMAAAYSSTAAAEINKRLPFGITVDPESVKEAVTSKEAAEAFVYELLDTGSESPESSGKPESSDKKGVAWYIERRAVAPVFIRIISAVMWAVSFGVSGAVLRIIVRVILAIRKISPVKACDSALGGMCGAVLGCGIILVCTSVVVMLVNVTGGMTNMNEEIFSDTIIFGNIYRIISAKISLSV